MGVHALIIDSNPMVFSTHKALFGGAAIGSGPEPKNVLFSMNENNRSNTRPSNELKDPTSLDLGCVLQST